MVVMKVQLVFVPVGGGETEYSLTFELPAVPQKGDYISVSRPGDDGTADFIVRRTWWQLHYPKAALDKTASENDFGTEYSICVECEYALSPYSGTSHKERAKTPKIQRNGACPEFDDTMF